MSFSDRRHRGLRFVMLCVLAIQSALAADPGDIDPATLGTPIDRFVISGNDRTQERFLHKWTGLAPGRILTREALEIAEQELLDRGLFREIRFSSERVEPGETELRLTLRERRYTLLLPRASRNNSGDVKAGFRLRMNNLQGADRTLEALLQRENQADGDDADEFSIDYTMEMFDRPYDLELAFERVEENTEIDDFANIHFTDKISIGVARDWHISGWRTPLTVSTAVTFEDFDIDLAYPETVDGVEPGRFNRLAIGFRLNRVHRDRYRRFGSLYSLTLERGFDWLGSDFTSNLVTFEVRGYRPLNAYDNIDYRLIFAASNDSPFGRLRFGLGGASTLRGLEDFDNRGDARIFTNIEYVFAYRSRPHLRHTLFIDIGNVWGDLESIELSDWEYTIGTGFRWKIDAFVKTDLFIDYGYDVENSEGKLYGGTSLNF